MKNLFNLFILLFMTVSFASAQEITGVWKTFDDETGEAKSYVTITEKNGKYTGSVTKILNKDRQDKVCDKCDGKKKDQPILGMEILWGLKKVKSNKYSKGKILDPNNGNVYWLSIYPKDENELKVRGFIGMESLGRTQVWKRVE